MRANGDNRTDAGLMIILDPPLGRLAIPLIACDPNFLAHASLATTDIAISACLAMFTELYLAGRGGPWRQRVALPGLCFGASLLAKASALPFAVNIMLVFELNRVWQKTRGRPTEGNRLLLCIRSLWGESRAFRRDFWQILGLGTLAAFLYCGSDWRADSGWLAWANSLAPGTWRDAMVFLAERTHLFPNAGQAIVYQIQHNFRGHGAFVAGEWHDRAVWYYFPLALTMKLTLPVLVLLAVTILVRPKSYAHALGLLVGYLFLFTLNCRVQIGIRLILPFLSLLLVALAVSLVRTWPERWAARVRPLGLAVLCAAILTPMLWSWPHGLCYINQLWGGPESGYRCLSDSNYDWGQGLGDLQRWQQANGQPPLKIWYYGADPRLQRRPELLPLHSLKVATEDDLRERVNGHYLAVGTTLLYSNPSFSPSAEPMITLLKAKKPIARTMTFFIYDFTEPTNLVAAP